MRTIPMPNILQPGIATNIPACADATEGRHRTLLPGQRDFERPPKSLEAFGLGELRFVALRFIAINTTIAIFIAMKDDAIVKTFDDLEVLRLELARGYLQLLNAQPHRPIALFAPRRVGKTFFLENDLTPAAHAEGFITVYADLRLHKTIPSNDCMNSRAPASR